MPTPRELSATIRLDLEVAYASPEAVTQAALKFLDAHPDRFSPEDLATEREQIKEDLYGAFYALIDEYAAISESDAVEVVAASLSVLRSDSDKPQTPVVDARPQDSGCSAGDQERATRGAHLLRGIDWLFDTPSAEDTDTGTDDTRASSHHEPELVKGLLWHASNTLVDSLLDDICDMENAGDDFEVSQSRILSELPRRFDRRYNELFARRLLAAVIDVTSQLASEWRGLPSVGHELALDLLIREAESTRELFHIDLRDDWTVQLYDRLFQDLDYELLYARSMDGVESYGAEQMGHVHLDFDSWFQPFGNTPLGAPYATVEP